MSKTVPMLIIIFSTFVQAANLSTVRPETPLIRQSMGEQVRVLHQAGDLSAVGPAKILTRGLPGKGYIGVISIYDAAALPQQTGMPQILLGTTSALTSMLPEEELPESSESYRILVPEPGSAVLVGRDENAIRLAVMTFLESLDSKDRTFSNSATGVVSPRFPVRMITADLQPGFAPAENVRQVFLPYLEETGFNRIVLPQTFVDEGTAKLALQHGLDPVVGFEGLVVNGAKIMETLERIPSIGGIQVSISDDSQEETIELIKSVCRKYPGKEIYLKDSGRFSASEVLSASLSEISNPIRISTRRPKEVFGDVGATGWVDSATRGFVLEAPRIGDRLFRWLDWEYVSGFAARAEQEGAAGYSVSVNEWDLAKESMLSDFARENCCNWEFRFEKNPFRYRLWGLSGVLSEIPGDLVEKWFIEKHGEALGKVLFESVTAGSRILSDLTTRFPTLSGGNAFPEALFIGDIRPEPSGVGVGSGRFISIADLIVGEVDDGSVVGIGEYAGTTLSDYPVEWDSRVDPVEAADRLDALTVKARDVRRVEAQIAGYSGNLNELRSYDLELQITAHLGHVYAHLLRAAPEVVAARVDGKEEHLKKAADEIKEASDEWGSLVRIAETLYVPLRSGNGAFDWKAGSVAFTDSPASAEKLRIQGEFVRLKVGFAGPLPPGSRFQEAFEREICSATDSVVVEKGLLLGSTKINWKETSATVFDGTAELSDRWVRKVDEYARFISGRRLFPEALEGSLYGKYDLIEDSTKSARISCPVGTPAKMWANGSVVFDADKDSAAGLKEGIDVPLRVGRNVFIFRSDLKRGEELPWGFGPRIEETAPTEE